MIRLVINTAVPALVYVLIRPHAHSDLTTLVVGAAIPTAYTAGVMLVRRHLDPAGVIAVACFCIGLLLAIVTRGNELVFTPREDLWTGPLGLARLISVAMRRPLLLAALRLAARRNPQIAERLPRPGHPG